MQRNQRRSGKIQQLQTNRKSANDKKKKVMKRKCTYWSFQKCQNKGAISHLLIRSCAPAFDQQVDCCKSPSMNTLHSLSPSYVCVCSAPQTATLLNQTVDIEVSEVSVSSWHPNQTSLLLRLHWTFTLQSPVFCFFCFFNLTFPEIRDEYTCWKRGGAQCDDWHRGKLPFLIF